MIQYTDIKDYVSGGDDAATIVTKLNADMRHERDLADLSSLNMYLAEHGILFVSGVNGPSGVLVDTAKATANADAIRGVDWLITAILKDIGIRATKPHIGQQIEDLFVFYEAFVDPKPVPTAQVRRQIDDVTRGRKYGSVTEEQVQALIDAETEKTRVAQVDKDFQVAMQTFEDVSAAPDRTKESLAQGLEAVVTLLRA